MSEIRVNFRATKEELRAALDRHYQDVDELFQFLIGARAAGASFNGRTAAGATLAACDLLRLGPEDQKRLGVR